MKTSPIQVVLNPKNFIEALENNGFGSEKDFYKDSDTEFTLHKSKISNDLIHLGEIQRENKFTEVTYAKIILKPSAIAKSHSPTSKLFVKNIAQVVGSGDIGELFVEILPNSIEKLISKVSEAEEVTKLKEKKKPNGETEMVTNTSQIRSEVGAIDAIQPYTISDKRKFSISDGVQWLSNPETGGAYIIELFDYPPHIHDWDSLSPEKYKLFKSFQNGLQEMGMGLVALRANVEGLKIPMLTIRIEKAPNSPIVQFFNSSLTRQSKENPIEINLDIDRHTNLLGFLDVHPLVRRIILPPKVSSSQATYQEAGDARKDFTFPVKNPSKTYPKIGIIDGGVSKLFDPWIIERRNFLDVSAKDENHGSFIAGLLLSGQTLNGSDICSEEDGCEIADLDLLPKTEFSSTYHPDPLDFFTALEEAVIDVKAKNNVRVFNFSLNVDEHPSTVGYSLAAKILDRIAHDNDVIFIISAGNTSSMYMRKEWPEDSIEALKILATSKNDTVKTPAESCRNLSVSALNPPNLKGIVPYALSNYSCRGPGSRIGLKPDLAHIGGSGTPIDGVHGLYSLLPGGTIVNGCGTSYAAPNAAKTIACIEHGVEGVISRESLIGLTLHHAILPEPLKNKKLKEVAKHLVGFGVPSKASEILDGNSYAISLVFANRIQQGYKMSFKFTWPPSLVNNGKCKGHVRLTVISTPPFDYTFGSEFARVNIEGHLRQEQQDSNYKGRLKSVFYEDSKKKGALEKSLISNSFKWSPYKVYEANLKGCGPSTNWSLDVEYLTRPGETLPKEGIPFTAILTITDPQGKAPVFNEMRQVLQSQGVKISDIKTAAKILTRI